MGFRGIIQPRKPSLFPGIPQGAGVRGGSRRSAAKTTKAKELESPNGMVQQTTEYNLAEAGLNQKKVALSNQLYSILKNKYHGDMKAYSRDSDVRMALNQYQVEKASLSASRNQVESEKGYKDAAVLKTQDNEGMDKYHVNQRGRRSVLGVDGRAHVEGETYTTSDKKEHTATLQEGADYLTYGEWYQVKDRTVGMRRRANGSFAVEQTDWDASINYTDNHLDDWASKNKALAGTDGWGGGKLLGIMNGSHMRISGGGKSDVKKIGMMTKSMLDGIPTEVTRQLDQEYWEKKYDRRFDMIVTKNGTEMMEKGSYAEFKKDIKAGKSAKDLGLSKDLYNAIKTDGSLITDERVKRGIYAGNRIRQTMSGTTTTEYNGPKFLKLTEAASGAYLDVKKQTYEVSMVAAAEVNASANQGNPENTFSVLQKNKDGTYKRGAVTRGVSIETPDSQGVLAARNVISRAAISDEDGEISYSKAAASKNSHVSTHAANVILPNGQVYSGDALDHMYIYETQNNVFTMPSVKNGNYTMTPALDAKGNPKLDKDGNVEYAGSATSGYRAYTVVMSDDDFKEHVEPSFVASRTEGQAGMPVSNAKGGADLADDSLFGNSTTGAGKEYGFGQMEADWSINSDARTFTIFMEIDENSNSLDHANGKSSSTGNKQVVDGMKGSSAHVAEVYDNNTNEIASKTQ